MNRRAFLQGTGLFTVGSAFGSFLGGCGAQLEVSIPRLGTFPPPIPVPGMTYIWASKIGCALDCNLSSGLNKHTGDQATDDGPRINTALAGASASNPITLILDGEALVSGLFLPAGGYWNIVGLGDGTGFFIKSGTNNDGIHNGPAIWYIAEPGPPAPSRGSSVSLCNFAINGNAGDGYTGVSTTGYPQGNLNTYQLCFTVNLMNLNNVVIENLAIINSPCYHICLSNAGNVKISGCILRSLGLNTDGLHFDGPANDIVITDCNLTTGDDGIALNCPEGFSGNISRVNVSNCTFNSPTLMRLNTIESAYGNARFFIDTVSVSNCRGSIVDSCFELGDGAGSNPNAVTGLTISDCNLSAPAILNIWANFGTIALKDVHLSAATSWAEAPGYSLARTDLKLLNPDSGYFAGSSLTIENCSISGDGQNGIACLILENGSSIGSLEINGFGIDQCRSQELVNIISGMVGQLTINSANNANIQSAVSSGGFSSIGIINGTGVLATGWEFPDAVMADGVPYISANTGLPSIKFGGVVYPYS